VSHANAALTPRARLRLARLVVDEGWPIARAAESYGSPREAAGSGPLPRPVLTAHEHRVEPVLLSVSERHVFRIDPQ
jgi:hypothetical protein